MTDPDRENAEDILLEFAAEPEHDRETLERYLRDHPRLADQLVDLSLELRLQRTTSAQSVPEDEEWVETSLKSFKTMMGAGSATATAADPFAPHSSTALVAIRKRLGVPSAVMHGFRTRIVDVATVPARFLDMLARELGSSAEGLRGFLARPPQLAVGLSYKADEAPTLEGQRISFEKLLLDARVPEEDRVRLLAE
ncbi:hypothetical protein [Sphingomonas cavernae]|uniref:Uncharacterized protein n=1 Tax=Sphingomonas cavernae TaxID=2320861 RepID=A0A418WJU5_9SPHN|nr:hypothetical protein [Sphingomonas cavernae]RJF90311.1 hypothetical protein D3876_08585 [Sphingomonas cavernae]